MNIGLFFGSFNPIHIGHLIIANHVKEFSDLDEIWFVISPHNPFKEKKTLLNDYLRLEMVHLAISDYFNFKASDIEFSLPKPSYTCETLTYLKQKFPKYNFNLIMGQDNIQSINRWKNAEYILKNHNIYVYPRILETENIKIEDINFVINPKGIIKINAPIVQISSTEIRNMIKENKNIKPLVPYKVFDFISGSNLYVK